MIYTFEGGFARFDFPGMIGRKFFFTLYNLSFLGRRPTVGEYML